MKTLTIIPSRLSATRLPGKPLLKINDMSIISHVFKKAEEAKIGEVVVAAGHVGERPSPRMVPQAVVLCMAGRSSVSPRQSWTPCQRCVARQRFGWQNAAVVILVIARVRECVARQRCWGWLRAGKRRVPVRDAASARCTLQRNIATVRCARVAIPSAA